MKTFTSQAANIEQNVALSNIFDELIKDQQNSLMQANENHKKYLGGMFMCLFGIENCKKGAVANSYLGWYKNEKEFAKEVARKLDRFPQWIFPSIDFQAYYDTELSPFVKHKFGHFFLAPLQRTKC